MSYRKYIKYILLFLVISVVGFADEIVPIQLNDLFFEGKFFTKGARDPLITNNGLPDRYLQHELNLHFRMDLFKYGYWNNMIHSQTDNSYTNGGGQFRLIGWKFEVGIRVASFLDVEYGHFSRHLLDASLPYGFPVQDFIGFKLYLFRHEDDSQRRLIPSIF